jgi:hypothetical protein
MQNDTLRIGGMSCAACMTCIKKNCSIKYSAKR